MNIRERWRRAKERRRKINEAIERGLTAEQKLVLLESRQPAILRNLPILVLMVFGMCALVFVWAIVDIGYGLRYHFGENAWENMVEAGRVEFGSGGGNPHIALWMLAGLAVFFLISSLYDMMREEKTVTKLKREILARLDAKEIKK